MSKIGQKVITVPSGVQVNVAGSVVNVKGSKGEIKVELPREITIEQKENELHVKRDSDRKQAKAFHGLFRSLIANAVAGVETHWQKRLEIVGTGFNVKMQGQDLVFKIGFSHPVVFKAIPGIQYQVDGANKVIVMGSDKQLVGQTAYRIKLIRKPDAYKGKGIRFEGEKIRIKPGKKAKTG